MPSPRSSPALRPQSPLSHHRYDMSGRFDSLRAPSPRVNVGNSQRRANTQSLKLPSLPRFHPANYPPSTHSSVESTPDRESVGSPQPPMSPRAHQRLYSDAQKHLFAYQHEMISAAVRASSPNALDKPSSPKLVPLGSPGPVTPLELDYEGGYLAAGSQRSGVTDPRSTQALVDELIRQEAGRRQKRTNDAGSRSSHGR